MTLTRMKHTALLTLSLTLLGCSPTPPLKEVSRFEVTYQSLFQGGGGVYIIHDTVSQRDYVVTPHAGVAELRPGFSMTNLNLLVTP